MSKIDDGGPMFPHHEGQFLPDGTLKLLHEYGLCQAGTSHRNWYAGMVMQGLLASEAAPEQGGLCRSAQGNEIFCEVLAQQCFEYADAMIRESRREGGDD